jgi:hypothetical protein
MLMETLTEREGNSECEGQEKGKATKLSLGLSGETDGREQYGLLLDWGNIGSGIPSTNNEDYKTQCKNTSAQEIIDS